MCSGVAWLTSSRCCLHQSLTKPNHPRPPTEAGNTALIPAFLVRTQAHAQAGAGGGAGRPRHAPPALYLYDRYRYRIMRARQYSPVAVHSATSTQQTITHTPRHAARTHDTIDGFCLHLHIFCI
eukprot:scaffold354_cov116-Isochrysis_galbana.AAC.5